MQKAENASGVIVYSGLTEDQWQDAIMEAKARAVGHGYGANDELGHYFELFPDGRTSEVDEAIESAMG